MKTAKRIAIAAVAVVVAGGGCFGGYTRYQKKKDSKRVVDVVPVNLLVTDYWADESTTDATVASSGSQNVYLDSEKLVKKLYVKVGDKVKKGDVLLKYDMTVVELSVQQKKSQIALVRQQISEEEKKLAKLKTLRPSEEAPAEPDIPDEPDVPDEPDTPDDPDTPDKPDTPDTPIKLLDNITSLAQSEEVDENGALVFYCSEKAAVDRNFMGALIISHKTALLNVCDESGTLLYSWYLDGANTSKELIEDWNVADGVEKTDDSVSFNSLKFKAHGIFQVPADNTVPDDGDDDDSDIDDTDPDDSDDTDIDDTDGDGDYTPDDNSDDSDDDGDENYMYSRKELASMISEKETEIKSLQLDLKSAKLEYKNSLKQKKDGKVVAEQDGIVTRAGDDDDSGSSDSGDDGSDDLSGLDEGTSDSGYSDDEDYSDEGTSDNGDKPYVTVRGSKKTRININVGEMNLDKFQEGAIVQGMSYDTSESFSAKVLSIDPEPVSYSSYNYSDNPNSSTYSVLAEVQEDDVTFSIDNYLSVTIPQDDTESDGMYLPLQYVRKDGANYYVMKADKKGKLKKQYVATGKVIWGSYIEIKKGVSNSDMICFPYGKNVKEGVKTRETDSVEE